jgi:hypothetical protein
MTRFYSVFYASDYCSSFADALEAITDAGGVGSKRDISGGDIPDLGLEREPSTLAERLLAS